MRNSPKLWSELHSVWNTKGVTMEIIIGGRRYEVSTGDLSHCQNLAVMEEVGGHLVDAGRDHGENFFHHTSDMDQAGLARFAIFFKGWAWPGAKLFTTVQYLQFGSNSRWTPQTSSVYPRNCWELHWVFQVDRVFGLPSEQWGTLIYRP